jgi:hypothetical protein
MPSTWFSIIKKISNTSSTSLKALDFASIIEGGVIDKQISIAEHLTELYKNHHPSSFKIMIPNQMKLKITMDHMSIARKRLSREKATGLDHLKDTMLKSKFISDHTTKKIKRVFQGYLEGSPLSDYLR